MKLTKTKVDSLEAPSSGQALHWDEELRGFGVRITTSGARSYVAQGRVNGKTRRVTLGQHGRWTCDEARRQAREVLRNLDMGIDPQVEKQRSLALGVTLQEVAVAYIKDRDLKDSSIRDIKRHVVKNFAIWATQPVASISREGCLKLFRDMSGRAPSQANQAFVVLRALLNYARAAYRTPDGRPTLPENPVAVLCEAKLWNRERARETRIPMSKVGAVWASLDIARANARTKDDHTSVDYVCFLLLTGARASEAGELTWDRVVLGENDGSWHLPDPKNGRAVTFPLNSAAQKLLRDRLGVAVSPFVFPCWGKTGHITDARATMQKVSRAAGLHLSRHDLRRTFTAIALNCGVEMWKAELITGHVPQSVTLKHYTETSDLRYLSPETEAIGAWLLREAAIAVSVQSGGNVRPLRA